MLANQLCSVTVQWQGQQLFQSATVSAVMLELHHADLMLLEPHQGAMVMVERRDDIPKDTTGSRGVVIIAMVVEA